MQKCAIRGWPGRVGMRPCIRCNAHEEGDSARPGWPRRRAHRARLLTDTAQPPGVGLLGQPGQRPPGHNTGAYRAILR